MREVFNHRVTARSRYEPPDLLLAVLLAVPCATLLAGAACRADDRAEAPGGQALLYHEVAADGAILETHHADRPFNPASVVKVATTLWVLESLGPDHRFTTRFGYRGTLDPDRGLLQGDLIVAGGADPDFHVENAFLVARALNRYGIRDVTGGIRIDDRFWIGWEGGSERREPDPEQRARAMAARLSDALDPARWDAATRRGMNAFLARRSLAGESLPAVAVRGAPGRDRALAHDTATTWVVAHVSNPVALTLKRFNAFSNNDIERFEASVGPAADLATWIRKRLGLGRGAVRVSTLSGLGSNRLDARAVVGLLQALQTTCRRLGLAVGDVLPVLGCDPGTLENFPRLDAERFRAALVAKTGSLNETDGGVAVLAGLFDTRQGGRLFCVASPRAGGRLPTARAAQESWLIDRIADGGGPRPGACPAPLPFSDDDARVDRALSPVHAIGVP